MCCSAAQGAHDDEDAADDGHVGPYRGVRRDTRGVAGEADHACRRVVRTASQQAGRDEHPESRIELDVVMLGPRSHVVLAGEIAVHQGLNEVTASTLLGFVDAALPQHLRTDDGRGLFGDDGVPGAIVAARASAGNQDHDPTFERLAKADRAGDARPDVFVWTGDRLHPGVVAVGSAGGGRHPHREYPAHRFHQ